LWFLDNLLMKQSEIDEFYVKLDDFMKHLAL